MPSNENPVHGFLLYPRTQTNIANSGQSEVKNDEKQFQVSLNVKQFKPEVEVKVVNNFIVIHGKHEEKIDDGGFCSREFTRHYMLLQGCEADTVTSSLDQGVLTITAPKKAIEEPPNQERKITVNVENSKSDGK
ncbi:UNVERIFIED_CONTAM: l [Trichonephila clavipes]